MRALPCSRRSRHQAEAGRSQGPEGAAVRSHPLEEAAGHSHLRVAAPGAAGCSRRRAAEEVVAAAVVVSGCNHLAGEAAEEAATAADRSRPGVRPTFNSSF